MSDRYIVKSLFDARKEGLIKSDEDNDYTDWESKLRSVLIDTETKEDLFYDYGEPEDNCLVRDLAIFPDLLNKQDKEIKALEARIEELKNEIEFNQLTYGSPKDIFE